MKPRYALAALPFLIAGPAPADEPKGEPILPGEEELRDLGEEAVDMLRRLAERLDPMAERLRGLMDDMSAFEPPERLPNGDIIIRRKPESPAPGPAPEGGVSL